MSTRATRIAIRIIVALAVVGGLVWFLKHRANAKAQKAEAAGSGSSGGAERVVAVQVAQAKRQPVPVWLEGLGTVAAAQQVTVRSQVDGVLQRVMFVEGQAVKAGQQIAQIDPRPFRVQLDQANGALARDRAAQATAKKNYERYKGLVEQKLVAQQQLDELAAQVGQNDGAIAIDRAAVEAAQLQLDYARIKSPIDGIVGVRLVDAGNLVHASDQTGLVVVTQIDPVAILFTVPQDKLSDVAAAMARGPVKVEIWNRDGSQTLASGTLAVLDNQINQATGTLRLKAMASNPARLLWPQGFVKARMLLEERQNALVVPAVAIQRGPQGAYVYVVGADKAAQMKPVTVGLQTGDIAVIEKGLEGGESVVIEGANQIRPGGHVEPTKPAGARGGKPAPGQPTGAPGAAPTAGAGAGASPGATAER